MASSKLRDRCKYYRRKAGYQQKDLADLLYVDPSTLSKWENGRAAWPPDALTRYCELLDLDEVETKDLFTLARVGRAIALPADQGPKESDAERSAMPIPGAEPAKAEMDSLPTLHTITITLDNVFKKRTNRLVIGTGLILAIGLVVGSALWNARKPEPPAWQEAFDPIQTRWMQTSAVWEDIDGPSALLRENNPDEDFGKVESEVITVNVDNYPILRINVKAIDLDASYTIQILDKRTDTPKIVLKGITYPGEHTINLAQEMGWQGSQAFTINIWISGEGKSAAFDLVSIEAE